MFSRFERNVVIRGTVENGMIVFEGVQGLDEGFWKCYDNSSKDFPVYVTSGVLNRLSDFEGVPCEFIGSMQFGIHHCEMVSVTFHLRKVRSPRCIGIFKPFEILSEGEL